MLTSLRTIVPPIAAAVSTDLARRHCRIDSQYDDDLLNVYIVAATDWAQQYLNRALITQTLRWTIAHTGNHSSFGQYGYNSYGFGGWIPLSGPYNIGHGIELPRSPLQEIMSVSIGYPDAPDVILDSTQYTFDVMSEPGRLRLPYRYQNTSALHHLSVTYTAGYGDSDASIPTSIKHAILLYTSFLYENRGDVEATAPAACASLLWPYRMMTF